jgi:acylpyruvate hydrolase
MRLVTYSIHADKGRGNRLGAVLDENSVLDLAGGSFFYLEEIRKKSSLGATLEFIPPDILSFLTRGDESVRQAARTVDAIREWQRTEKRNPTGARGEPLVFSLAEITLQAPVPRPGKIICMGNNYYSHTAEQNMKPSDIPLAFFKAPSAVVGPEAPIPYPRSTKLLDYEIELAVVIGTRGKDIPRENAFDYIAGYTILNDISARDLQLKEMKSGFLILGKSLDASAPMGPWLVTRDEIPDPQTLGLELRVNDGVRQKSSTDQMIHKIPDLIAYWSQITLEPGDVITTGTPGGVGIHHKPNPQDWLLHPGDRIEAAIEGIGVLRNTIV